MVMITAASQSFLPRAAVDGVAVGTAEALVADEVVALMSEVSEEVLALELISEACMVDLGVLLYATADRAGAAMEDIL